jgi:RecA-family ATPase
MNTTNGAANNTPVPLDLDDEHEDESEHGGLSQEEQFAKERQAMKEQEPASRPRPILVPLLNPFAAEGRYIGKLERAKWRSFDFVVKELGIAVGPPTLLIAASYSGKSFLLQHLALCAVSGQKLLGLYEVKQGKVLHLDYEQGVDQSEIRYQRLMNGHGIKAEDMRPDALLFARPKMQLDSPDAEKELRWAAEGYAFCIIDSFRAALGKTDENSSEARGPLTMLGNVSEATGCAFIVIHHQGKGETPKGERTWGRGSSAIFDSAGSVFSLKVEEGVYQLSQEKSRTGRFSGVTYLLEDTGDHVESINATEGVQLVPAGGKTVEELQIDRDKDGIIQALRKNGALRAKALETQSGVPHKRYGPARQALEDEETVIPEADKMDKRAVVYRLSEAFVARMEASGGWS